MRKLTVLLFALTFVSGVGFAQILKEDAVNPEFVRYAQLPDSIRNGYMPSPIAYDFTNSPVVLKSTLPSSYDLRSQTTILSPRNQGSHNTCWAFATMDALQSTWTRLGLTAQDYSSKHLFTCDDFLIPIESGGTSQMAVAYLADFKGPVLETADPYDFADTTCTEISNDSKPTIMAGAYFFPYTEDNVKNMIYNYGAVMVGMCNNALYSTTTFNSTNNALYITAADTAGHTVNHAVTIVGWDDDYSASNFTRMPSSNGAWIVKNTVGTSKFDGGYFYVSYDSYLFGNTPTVYTSMIPKPEVDTIYQYEQFGAVKTVGVAASKPLYVCASYSNTSKQTIKYVGTYAASAGQTITVIIGDAAGNVLDTVETVCPYPGYYAFPVSASVTGNFKIIVKYQNATGVTILPAPFETSADSYCSVSSYPSGQYYSADGTSWFSLSSLNYNACIKVYAKNESSFTANAFSVVATSVIVKGFEVDVSDAEAIAQVSLLSLKGDVLVSQSNKGNSTVSINANAKGVFLVRLAMTDGSVCTQKIIIK